MFRQVLVVPVDAPDPVAPAEWNLANLRTNDDDTKHYWTIQIGAYQGSPQRKQAAVEAVKEARAQGVEAYYYHGDTVSSVCVGCWPKEALRIEGAAMVRDGQEFFGAPEGQDLVLAPGVGLADRDKRSLKGRGAEAVQPKVTIIDQTMIQMKEKFPQHFVNGEEMIDKSGVQRAKPSLVVQVPVKSSGTNLAGNMRPQGPAVQQSSPPPEAVRSMIVPDSKSSGPGTGRLKSVGK